ncbi:MAG: LacI family DNA-binding transcriptional regulator [Pseudomonadota bacterium]
MKTIRPIPTLEDVAEMAAVSTATVSRSLNSPERVGEKTRKRVMEAVEKLGYTPNFAAQVMAAKRSFTIGAVLPTMENAIFARGMQAFQEELYHRGYVLLVSSFLYDPDIEEDQIRTMVARGADGLLLIGHDRDPSIYKYLQNHNVPTLVSWMYNEAEPHPSVGFDNRKSMANLVAEVIAKGHRKLAAIVGNKQHNDRVRQRILGMKDSLRAHGLDTSSLEIVETPNDIESGGDSFEALMSKSHQPTAIICGNDVLAVGAMRRARQLNIDVPGDVSVTGFDDIELAKIVDPPLTTVHVPHQEMGRRAAGELISLIKGETDAVAVNLKTTVKIRASLGSPKS